MLALAAALSAALLPAASSLRMSPRRVAGRLGARGRAALPWTALRSSSVAQPEGEGEGEAGRPRASAVEATGQAGEGLQGKMLALYKFTRPHTIRGTILASCAAVLRTIATNDNIVLSAALFQNAFVGMIALIMGNAFIVGINQIYDKDIDRINKPFLPVAAGEMSTRTAWGVVAGSLLGGLGLVKAVFSPMIFKLYSFGLFLGAIYSVPPLQLKRFPLAAGGIIAIMRGFLLNVGVYYAIREALLLPFQWDPIVLFIARFMTVFAGIIAVTKDLPDVAGDVKYNISTFASKMGVGRVATGATAVLALNYLSAIAEGLLRPGVFNPSPMIGGHAIAMAYAISNRLKLNPKSEESIKTFYGRVWHCFYAEYALYAVL